MAKTQFKLVVDKVALDHKDGPIHGYIITSDNYQGSMKHLLRLARVAIGDYPSVTMGDIHPFIITHSSTQQGMRGVHFSIPMVSRRVTVRRLARWKGYKLVRSLPFRHI